MVDLSDMAADDDIIAAQATPPGAGGIAIVRVSGAGCAEKIAPLFAVVPRWEAGRFTVMRLVSPSAFQPSSLPASPSEGLGQAVALYFQAPHSYTGEEVVELQVHGGRVTVRRVLEALAALGVRPAEPGEFTRRAFLNGRLELSQAEAVMDVIAAQSDHAARLALEQLEGRLGRRVEAWYAAVLGCCAELEASLDFAEDEVEAAFDFRAMPGRLCTLREEIASLVATWQEGLMAREGVVAVLSGRPNAGKSALFNALLERQRAIVSPVPGTTRDTLEETLVLRGFPVRLTDTAGLRDAACPVEREGVARAEAAAQRSDIHLRVLDATDITPDDIAAAKQLDTARTLVVLNKTDLAGNEELRMKNEELEKCRVIGVSAVTGDGMEALRAAMEALLGELAGNRESLVAVNARHRDLLVAASDSLARAETLLAAMAPVGDETTPIAAQALHDAASSLGHITGRGVGDDILSAIFSRFCVGK